MKIGLSGTVSVGKSSLVQAMSQLPEFKDYECITERSKYLRDLGIPLNTDSTVEGQIIFTAERASELLKPNIIVDRTIWDVNAFTINSRSIDDINKERILEMGKALMDRYDFILYISPEGVDIEDNGVRTIDVNYRNLIDTTIKELLEAYPPKNLYTIEGTHEHRIKTILDIYDRHTFY
jgi:nicotinamide riboside kinase